MFSCFRLAVISSLLMLALVSCSELPPEPERTHFADIHNPDRDVRAPLVDDMIAVPTHGADGVGNPVEFGWTAAVDDHAGVAEYRVYVDGVSPPRRSSLAYAGDDLGFTFGPLDHQQTYYWQVVAVDAAGNEAASDVWRFSVAAFDDLILLEPGSYMMGSPDDEPYRQEDRERQHRVTLSRGFWISPVEVTQRLVEEVQQSGYPISDLPAGGVNWMAAIGFCNAISIHRGLQPAYAILGEGHVRWDPSANGYRLPTEAEWEYACRAGTTEAFSSGPLEQGFCDEPNLGVVGWYCGNSDDEKQPVGQLDANPWGLHDMHGNILEWCWDIYRANLGDVPVIDPVIGGFEQNTTNARVARGGSYWSHALTCRSAFRMASDGIVYGYSDQGFRLVRSIPSSIESTHEPTSEQCDARADSS